MAETQRIRGLFGGESHPRATDEESGLRMRPSSPSFEQRKSELASGLLDLSDQAVELPDEDDYVDDVRKSDTIPPGRVTAEEVAARAAKLESEPPALPVPLEKRSAPALPVPLVRKSAPTLAELGARVPVAPMPSEDDDRIDLDAIARLASPSDPVDVQMALSSRPPREKGTPAGRILGTAGGVVALLGIGFLIARIGLAPSADATPSTEAQPAAASEQPALVLDQVDVRAEESNAVELDEVRVESAPAAVVEEPPASEEPASEAATPAAPSAATSAPVPAAPSTAATGSTPAAAPAPTTPAPASAPAAAAVPSAGAPAEAPPASEPASAPAAPAPAADLPAAPSRDAVLAALRPIEGDVRTCAEGHFGVVPVRVTVASSGRVTTAVVTGGSTLGTPAGSCIARAVRGARFPAFSQDRFVVDYPFAL